MGTKWDQLKGEHDRRLRFMLIGSIAGSVVAYTILILAKLVWGLPDDGWWRVAIGPVAAFVFFIGMMWLASRSDLRDARREDELG